MTPQPEFTRTRGEDDAAGCEGTSDRFEELVSKLERHTLPPVDREPSLFLQAVFLVVLLMLAGLAGRAQADTLRVGTPRHTNGGIAVRVSAVAPEESDYAAGLYPGHCPPAPAETDDYTAVAATPTVLYVWPSDGETGRLSLCIWISHEDETIGARADRQVVIHAGSGLASPLSPAVNNHPSTWIVLGLLAWVVSLRLAWLWVVGIVVALGLAARRLRQRSARRRRRRHRHREREQIWRLRDRANSDSAPSDSSEHPTLEFPAVRPDPTHQDEGTEPAPPAVDENDGAGAPPVDDGAGEQPDVGMPQRLHGDLPSGGEAADGRA